MEHRLPIRSSQRYRRVRLTPRSSRRKTTSSRFALAKQELATELGKLSRRGSVATDTILLVGDEVPGPASSNCQLAIRRRSFCAGGSAALARASGRARMSTAAGLAAIVISSPVTGFRPLRSLRRRLDSHRQLHQAANPYLLSVPDLFEDDLLERGDRAPGVCFAQICPLGDGACELLLGQCALGLGLHGLNPAVCPPLTLREESRLRRPCAPPL